MTGRSRSATKDRRRETFVPLEPSAVSANIVQPLRKRRVALKVAVTMVAVGIVAAGAYAAMNWQTVLNWLPWA